MKKSPIIQIWVVAYHARRFIAAIVWSAWYNLVLRCHPGTTIEGWIRVTGRIDLRLDPRATVKIGRKVRINSGSLINPVGGHRRTILGAGKRAVLTIGANTGISSSTIVAMGDITIGTSVLIGGDCSIYDSNFHALRPEDRAQGGENAVKIGTVEIGSHAFVGTQCTILKNSRIGKASVVGACSLVTGTVPDGEVWAGIPAKPIRHAKSSCGVSKKEPETSATDTQKERLNSDVINAPTTS